MLSSTFNQSELSKHAIDKRLREIDDMMYALDCRAFMDVRERVERLHRIMQAGHCPVAVAIAPHNTP